ncbi:hypothetical protein [Tepidibacter hydrothermalis]|uniref:DUF4352 domain-containing protein n=1 Tax=Tepidibacter hydrothermalis TaxID=3036126 RepID=A0ABY8E8F3_9FIRM|nr:hypothetical protein [Tepidibacter hydrothermalis]WFD09182.1 hypothetical protein P4S50_12390 [Tepidibacter hydrothermalis]
MFYGINPYYLYRRNYYVNSQKKQNRNYNPQMSRREIFYGNDFNIERDNIDMIVNSIYDENNRLYVDGYIVNLTDKFLSEITDFNLILTDTNGRTFAEKTFDYIDIGGSLRPYQGKRIKLSFEPSSYGLFGVDLSNINWNYTYNYK